MPFYKYQKENMVSMRQAAAQLGLSQTMLWRMVRELGTVEVPTVKAGKRTYYTPEQVERIRKKLGVKL